MARKKFDMEAALDAFVEMLLAGENVLVWTGTGHIRQVKRVGREWVLTDLRREVEAELPRFVGAILRLNPDQPFICIEGHRAKNTGMRELLEGEAEMAIRDSMEDDLSPDDPVNVSLNEDTVRGERLMLLAALVGPILRALDVPAFDGNGLEAFLAATLPAKVNFTVWHGFASLPGSEDE